MVMEIKNDQLALVLHADLARSDIQQLISGIVKKELADVIRQTYDINRLCREVITREILQEKLLDSNQKLIEAVKQEVEKLISSGDIKRAVEQKLTGYGSKTLNTAIEEMQPFINGRVSEIIKDANMKDVMTLVSQKISNRIFEALSSGEEH